MFKNDQFSISSGRFANLKILHLTSNNIFFNHAIHIFTKSGVAEQDVWLFGRRETGTSFSGHVKAKHITVRDSLFRFRSLRHEMTKYDLVISHSLSLYWLHVLIYKPDAPKVLWIGWGTEYYRYIEKSLGGLFLPRTQSLIKSMSSGKKQYKAAFIEQLNAILIPSTIRKMDYFAPPIPEDFRLLSSNSLFSRTPFPAFCDWSYGRLDDYPPVVNDSTRKYILLGNSASCENNHLDLIPLLSHSISLNKAIKVLLPLSYGDTFGGKYKAAVSSSATNEFGSQTLILDEFLALDEYITLLSQCYSVVMGHKRQQGMGNVMRALLAGCRVFLKDSSPLMNFSKGSGLIVSDIDELADNPRLLFTPLSSYEVAHNSRLVREMYAEEAYIRKTQNLLAQI